ncbi:MAG: SagB/ThcOx family dehydrogenase [Leptospirales bacterium]|nr:SagB/ThcOx family dehydrogenase [Leptospirales bacterium]
MKFKTILTLALTFLVSMAIFADGELKSIALPKANIKSASLSDALTKRKSTREFNADKEISLQDLSNILWAAAGINRPATGQQKAGRTYPSAKNLQSVSVYVARKDGIYRYDHVKNSLEPVAAGDFRAKTGAQSFAATAPINLIYVSDVSEFSGSLAVKREYAAFDIGHCSENVYLYCAIANLGTVIRASIDGDAVAKILKLGKNSIVIAGQSIGHFK